MSLPFPIDNSIQSNFSFTTGSTYDGTITSNYITNISNILQTNINTKQDILTASTSLLGNGAAITNLAYANVTGKPTNFQADWTSTIINKPSTFPADMTTIYTKTETNNLLNAKENILTFSSPLTRTTNTITINLSTYSTTGNDPNYLLKTGGTLTGDLTVNNISLPSGGVIKCLDLYHYIQLGSYPLDTTTIQEYGTISFTIGPTKTQQAYINSSGLTATAFSGNGAALTNLAYTNITGKPTNFQADWTSTIINKPSTFPADMTTIYTKTETNNLLNTKEAILTFSSPLTRTTNTIDINLGSYSTTGTDTNYLLKTGGTMTGILTLPTNSWSIKTADNIDRIYFNNGGTTYFHSGNTNGDGFKFRSTAQLDIMTLTDAGALTATSFSGNGAALTNLAYTNITGKPTNFQADWTSTIINKPATFPADMTTIYTKTETDTLLNAKEAILTFSSPLTRTTNTIGINLGSYSTTGTDPNFLKLIGGTMTGQLILSTTTGNNPLYITSTSTTANNCINIKNNSTYNGYIGIGGTALTGNYANNLFIESASSAIILNTNGRNSGTTPNMIVATTGYVGINTTSPPCRFTIKMSYNDGNTGGLSINSDDGTTYNLKLYSYVQNSGQVGYKFEVNNIASSVNAVILNYNGVVTIDSLNTTNFLLSGYNLYYYLFNNTGGNHGDITDFNNIANFGFKFVMGGTNGPGTPSTNNQWYTWSMGLGANYAYSQYVCQCAIPRNTTFPYLSVRYKEGTTWGGWTGITSSFADGLTSGNKSISGNLNVYGTFYSSSTLSCAMLSVPNSGSDYVGVQLNTSQGTYYNTTLCIMYGTFTGFHRCFTKDALYDNNDPQKFKNDYMGRIVISTGKIATDLKTNDEWEIKYDKAGITIEDALPIIELSRTRKDKRVFGVLGMASRKNSRPERMIINSVGEGGIWVCNANGNIENGDYIQSSNYLGYGENQQTEFLCNYTVAKATMNCDFELDSPLYECQEIEDGIRIAFISCSYHCG